MTRHLMLIVLLLPAAVASSAAALAADEAAAPRSPGDLGVDERRTMMKLANGYNACVYREAMSRIEAESDVRRIADLAMGACQEQLDDLDHTITGWGLPAGFASRFTRTVRDRAARKLLAEIVVRTTR